MQELYRNSDYWGLYKWSYRHWSSPPGTHEQVIQPINHVQWSSARQTDSSHQGTTEGEPNKLDTASEKQAGVLMDKEEL